MIDHSTVLIADAHPIFLHSVASLLQSTLQLTTSTANSYASIFDILYNSACPIRLILTELVLPDGKGPASLSAIRRNFPFIPLLVFTSHDDLISRQLCLQAGADAVLSKTCTAAVLLDKVQQMLDPGLSLYQASNLAHPGNANTLTATQFKVYQLMAAGVNNRQISEKLQICERTVKTHISAVLRKLQVQNRNQAAVLFDAVASTCIQHGNRLAD